MTLNKHLFISISILVFCAVLKAQDPDIRKMPGFVNLEEIQIPGNAGEVTEISLGPPLLRIARTAHTNGDEHLSESLEGIFSIQVKSFDVDSFQAIQVRPIMDKIEKQLAKEKWERLVRVKKAHEMTNVSIKYDKGKAVGMLIMSLNPGNEASFVNIVGNIDLAQLGELSDFGVDTSPLDSLEGLSDKDERE
jgi:hypothetical protein